MPRPGARLILPILLAIAGVVFVVSRSPLQIREEGLFRNWGRDTSGSAGVRLEFETFRAEAMATTIQATLPSGSPALAESVFAIFRDVDARMSEWKPTSPLSEVNAAAGEAPVEVPDDLRAVVRRGMEIGDLTEGAFDVTWAALWGLWDFKAEHPVVPTEAEIVPRVALVDYRKVAVDDAAGTAFLPVMGMKIGLGGIAKGYALDRSAAMLRGNGASDFLLMAGGQVYVGGARNGRPWRVGVRDPRGAPDEYFAMLPVTDVSVSTSGDYESYFVVDGVWYHHILDPRTGRPARGLRSATVVSYDATLADALSTSIMVLGAERGLALADSLPGVEALVVTDAAEVRMTPGLRDQVEILRSPRP